MRKLLRMNIFLIMLTSAPPHVMIVHIGKYLFQSISELYQNKEGPFELIERPGGHSKDTHRCLKSCRHAFTHI